MEDPPARRSRRFRTRHRRNAFCTRICREGIHSGRCEGSVRPLFSLPRAFPDNSPASWEGQGEQEVGIDEKTGKVLVRVDVKYFRPAEVEYVVSAFFGLSGRSSYHSLDSSWGTPRKRRRSLDGSASVHSTSWSGRW